MTTQQTDRLGEIDIAISKLRVPLRKLLPMLADELEAAKDEPSSGYGDFNQKGELEYHPDHKVMSLVGMAALLAARYDVVSKGEGLELMGLWHELETDGQEAARLTELRAAVAFRAMMERMRYPDWVEIKTLEECLQGVESSLVEVAAGDIDDLATLNQLGALAGLSKRQMERYFKAGKLPPPDRKGGDGKAHKWKWATVRGRIEDISGRHLPEKFPGSRIVR